MENSKISSGTVQKEKKIVEVLRPPARLRPTKSSIIIHIILRYYSYCSTQICRFTRIKKKYSKIAIY